MAQYDIPEKDIKKMQKIGLDMLLYFDSFCKKYDLTYFMCGGCCIGAVRHKGFIPWDDDVDLFMPRKDYQKLKVLWEDTDRYEIQYSTRRFHCQSPSLAICDKKTTFIKSYRKEMDVSHGVAMDIFPLDGCPEGFARKKQKIAALLYSLFIVEKSPENHGKLINMAGRLALALVPFKSWRYRIWKKCEKEMRKYSIDRCSKITELCAGPYYMRKEYPKSAFSKAIRVDFEGYKLPIPVGYDEYLTMAFGNYMELPPEEDRKCHHEYEFLDMDHSYLDYKGTKYLT